MFEEIGKKQQIANVIDKGKIMFSYLYNHNLLLAKMREFCNGEIIRVAPTRFATNFISLESFIKRKSELKQLFKSYRWISSRFSCTNHSRIMEKIRLDQAFWDQAKNRCQILEPFDKKLHIIDK